MQPSIQMLVQGEIEHIYAASRRILHQMGILVEKRDTLEIFRKEMWHPSGFDRSSITFEEDAA